MSDHLNLLIARNLQQLDTLQPRPRSRFEPASLDWSGPAEPGDAWSEPARFTGPAPAEQADEPRGWGDLVGTGVQSAQPPAQPATTPQNPPARFAEQADEPRDRPDPVGAGMRSAHLRWNIKASEPQLDSDGECHDSWLPESQQHGPFDFLQPVVGELGEVDSQAYWHGESRAQGADARSEQLPEVVTHAQAIPSSIVSSQGRVPEPDALGNSAAWPLEQHSRFDRIARSPATAQISPEAVAYTPHHTFQPGSESMRLAEAQRFVGGQPPELEKKSVPPTPQEAAARQSAGDVPPDQSLAAKSVWSRPEPGSAGSQPVSQPPLRVSPERSPVAWTDNRPMSATQRPTPNLPERNNLPNRTTTEKQIRVSPERSPVAWVDSSRVLATPTPTPNLPERNDLPNRTTPGKQSVIATSASHVEAEAQRFQSDSLARTGSPRATTPTRISIDAYTMPSAAPDPQSGAGHDQSAQQAARSVIRRGDIAASGSLIRMVEREREPGGWQTARSVGEAAPETIVHVSIGRIEVRAAPSSAQEQAGRSRRGPALSLDEYLKRRDESQR